MTNQPPAPAPAPAQAPPGADVAPPTPGQPAPIVPAAAPQIGVGMFDVLPPGPRTGQELAAVREKRSELSDQLVSANGRREELARELRRDGVTGADRAGLEERIRLLDQRILRIEADIAITGRQITSAPSNLFASARVAETFGGLPPGGIIALGIVFNLFVLAPVAITLARLLWRRATRGAPPAPVPNWDHSPRLDRLEAAVDTVAEEMERVAESQRFVARLLAESHGSPALVGAARAPAAAVGVGRATTRPDDPAR